MVDFRIVQLTDLHIGDEDEYPFGVNLRANLIHVMADVERMNPDLLVITGDFCLGDPKFENYLWIQQQLDRSGIPYEVIGGNHDDISQMTTGLIGEDLSTEEDEYYFSDLVHDYHILYLDSAKGRLSDVQLDWVRAEIINAKGHPLMVFIHHPPVTSGVPHMDRKYPLQNGHQLMEILRTHEGTVQVFSGHYHVDRCVVADNVVVHITPSLFMQLFPYTEGFSIDHYQVGYRVIDFTEKGVQHAVRYLPGNRF